MLMKLYLKMMAAHRPVWPWWRLLAAWWWKSWTIMMFLGSNPIGSMVLVYMLTFGVYWWDPCYLLPYIVAAWQQAPAPRRERAKFASKSWTLCGQSGQVQCQSQSHRLGLPMVHFNLQHILNMSESHGDRSIYCSFLCWMHWCSFFFHVLSILSLRFLFANLLIFW